MNDYSLIKKQTAISLVEKALEELRAIPCDLDSAPLDTPIYLIDDRHNLYIGTLTEVRGEIHRGECLNGDSEYFFRNAIVGWAYYK